ncbi:MAG: hypothetical protein J6T86_02530 [Bacteroidales bacterium]|nr:hypothetical protein [Bacteroidales bacterium]
MNIKCWILSVLCGLLTLSLSAQEVESNTAITRVSAKDSVKVSKHSPTTAMLCSLIPGGGQIYNKKYWKIPIVYGALGASGYFIWHSAHKMKVYRDEFIYRRDGIVTMQNFTLSRFSDENLLQMKNNQRRNMEISIGVTAILYVLNIIDAMVDAHLYYFDVSDDLSLRWQPAVIQNYRGPDYAFGLSLQLQWR